VGGSGRIDIFLQMLVFAMSSAKLSWRSGKLAGIISDQIG